MEFIVGIVVIVVLFLLFRVFVLWYWRVNESVALLTEINQKLGQLVQKPPAG